MNFINDNLINYYWTVGKVDGMTPYGNGHINDTWLVDAENGNFILQRINKSVFLTDELVHNYEIHARSAISYQYENSCSITPLILRTKEKKYHFIDEEGYAWRLIEFAPNTISYDIAENPRISNRAAKAIGEFQLFLNTLKLEEFKDTIVGFHNLAERLRNFQKVVKDADCQLLLNANSEINQLLNYTPIVEETNSLLTNLPNRIIHNDTKLNNILFSGNSAVVIDLDTVMPGKLMFDFGDMVRSYTSPVAEDEADIDKTELRIDHFQAIVEGYLSALNNDISQIEKSSLLPGAKYIIYEQALRFLTDYLNGNVYYKTDYAEHNLVRARTQIKLLQSLMKQEPEMKKIIYSCTKTISIKYK